MIMLKIITLLLVTCMNIGLIAQSEYDNPDICDLWFEGKALYEQARYRASIDFLDQVTYYDSDYTEAYVYKGDAYFWLRQYEKALPEYNRAIEIYRRLSSEGNSQGREVFHGILVITHTQYDEKLEQLHNNRGAAYFEMGDYRSAYMDFQQAMDYNANSEEASQNFERTKKIMKAQGIPIPGTEDKKRPWDFLFSPRITYDDLKIGGKSCEFLLVNKIELKKDVTQVYFQVFNEEGDAERYINTKPGSSTSFYIRTSHGKRYDLIRAMGENENEKSFFIVQPGERASFVLEFDRIPDNETLIQIIEGNVDNVEACNFYDIQLK